MAPPYTLRCLGAVELRSPGGDLIRFRTRKHLALLIYLAVEPRHPHRRDRLADLLWPHASAAEARHSVATALSVLRGKLGPSAFEAGRDEVRFVFPDLELDLDRLARGAVLGDEYTPPLEVGGFLDGLEVLGAPDFMLWREQQRARWLPAIRDAALRLMDHYRRTGNTRRIEVVADNLLALDDLCEDAVRAKMEARAMAGDRVGALRIFEEWRLRLAEELGAQPVPLLENMAARLRRRGWEAGHPPAIPVSQTGQWRNQIFVGRAAEYRVLYESWERTVKSEPRHVLVLGDSGLGKTTLVERLVTAASLEGAVSVRAHCYEVERQIPYAAVGTLVRGLLDRPGAAATAPEELAELGRIVPEIRQRFAHLPPPRESQGETARLLLTEAVHQLATAVAEECPLILVLDDAHLADDVSVAVLHLIMRRVAQQRVMVVLTARETELAQAPHTARLLENRQALGLEALELPPMTEGESAELVDHWARDLSPALPPPVRRALVAAAAGNPMVLELLFRDWQANGADCLALAVSAMTVDPSPRSQEDTYRGLLERAFRDLGPEARAVLNLASILGSRMSDLRMYQLADLSLGQAMAGLAGLTDRRLLREAGGNLEFCNEVIRAYAYLNVPSPLRRALHGLIADRLLEAEEDGRWVPGLELAWHCVRAGRPESAKPFLLRGAREAIQEGAPYDAERALQTGAQFLSEKERTEAALIVAQAQVEQGSFRNAILTLSDAALSWSDAAEEMRHALLALASALGGSPDTELKEMLPTLFRIMTSTSSEATRTYAAYSASTILRRLRLKDLAATFFERVAPEPLQDADPSLRARWLLAKAQLADLAGYKPRLYSMTPELLAALEPFTNRGVQNALTDLLHTSVGCILLSRGSYAEASSHFEAALASARRIGNDAAVARCHINLAITTARLGRYAEAGRYALQSLEVSKARSDWPRLSQSAYLAAWSAALAGKDADAIQLLQREMPNLDRLQPQWLVQVSELWSADVHYAIGRRKYAVSLAAESLKKHDMRLLSDAHAGLFARWITLTALSALLPPGEAALLLRGLCNRLAEFDLVDQAEILSSTLRFQVLDRSFEAPEVAKLNDCLGQLPPAVQSHLRHLGVLP